MTKLISWLAILLFSNFLWASTELKSLEKQINHRLGQTNFEISKQQTNQIRQKMIELHNRSKKGSDISQAPNPNCGI